MLAYTEALEKALGGIVARAHGELALVRERADAIVAQAEARAAAADARFSALEKQISDKLAAVTNGKDGLDGADGRDGIDGGDGRDGTDGAPGKDGADGRDGIDGRDGVGIVEISPWEDGLMFNLSDERTFVIGPFKGADGKDGRDGKDADQVTDEQIAESVRLHLEANPPAAGRDGKDGTDGMPGKDGLDGRDGVDGRDGERGPEGLAGKLPLAKAWVDAVHYEGDVVSHDGSTWQALRDTGRAPAPGDWIMLAGKGEAGMPGADGRSFTVRSTYDAGADYHALDVVALNGSSFVAKFDNPGPCPGEGWQLAASRGARGQEGGRGERGAPGPAVLALHVDEEGRQTLIHADGSEVVCDLYPVLSRIA